MRKLARALAPYGLLAVLGAPTAYGVYAYVQDARRGDALDWARPDVWILLAACVLLAWVGFHLRAHRGAVLGFTRVDELRKAGGGPWSYLVGLPMVLRLLALGAIVLALARPQTYRTITREVDSVDIMIVLDLSRSMEETDMRRGDPEVSTDRLDAAQRVIRRFVARRQGDRIGLVVFAQQAMLQCPLTLDLRIVDRIVADLQLDDIPSLGTAIGDGLGMAIAYLRRSDARSKIVILLSDGDNNVSTQMTPQQAAEAAFEAQVQVFTVLVGSEEGQKQFGNIVNPATLRNIAHVTGGQFFNATDFAELQRGFDEVRRQLDKTRRIEQERKKQGELFAPLIGLALAFLLAELALASTRFRRFP